MNEFYKIFAQIAKNGEVMCVFRCDDYTLANQIAKATYGDEAYAVQCNSYKVQAGCYYINGKFIREDGITECERNITLLECKTNMIEVQKQLEKVQKETTADIDFISMCAGIDLNE